METSNTQRRTIVITGSNKGLGYSIIEILLKESTPYTIILAARNPDLGQKAAEELRSKYPNSTSQVIFRQLDVSDDKSVSDFVEWIKTQYGKIDALVNNAGVSNNQQTGDERAQIIKTNVIALINLTEKLLPYLTEEGKILNVSSPLSVLELQQPEIREVLDDENLSEKTLNYLINKVYQIVKDQDPSILGFSKRTYFASKALVNAYTRWILTKKLHGNQQAYATCPGWCRTDMGGDDADRSVEQGAASIAFGLQLPWKKDDTFNGKLIRDGRVFDFTNENYGLDKKFLDTNH